MDLDSVMGSDGVWMSGSGDGYGYGDGYGDGDGSGSGYGVWMSGDGYGSGYGDGDGDGYGYGDGDGSGSGYGVWMSGDGYGYWSGDGYGVWMSGSGYGSGDGYGDGSGYGYGSGYGSGYGYGVWMSGDGYNGKILKIPYKNAWICSHYLYPGALTRDGRKLNIGDKLFEPEIKLCEQGLHASLSIKDAYRYKPADGVLTKVKIWGDVIVDKDKLVATNRELIEFVNEA